MNQKLQTAIERLRDPASRGWFRDRCARWPERQRAFHAAVAAAGLPVRPLVEPLDDVRPDVWAELEPVTFATGDFRAEYRVSLRGSLVADVVAITYTARIDNAAPESIRAHPYLEVASTEPLLAAHRAIEIEAVSALAALGWARISLADELEQVEGLGRIGRVVELDVNGWLDGAGPLTPPDRTPVQPYLETLARRFATPDALRAAAGAAPPWLDELSTVLGTRLSPASYPSASWTVDFGRVERGAFDARFFTDVHASKLAPVWYYTDRFVVANPHPDALRRELAGWMIGPIGYTRVQGELVASVRTLLAGHGLGELDDYDLTMQVPSPYGGFALVGELLFRDSLRVFPPAPRVEEEGIDRNLCPRIGYLR